MDVASALNSLGEKSKLTSQGVALGGLEQPYFILHYSSKSLK